MRWLGIVAALACAMVGLASRADAARVGAELFGALNTYAMDEVNDAIDGQNADEGTAFETIGTGVTGGAGLRYAPNDTWMFSLVWEPLLAESLDESDADEAAADRLNLDAHSFQLTAFYMFPTQGKARFGVGAGLGAYRVAGQIVEADFDPPATDLEGNGVGLHALVLGEWTVAQGLALMASTGYRAVSVELDDVVVDSTGETLEASYSGFMARLGLSFEVPLGP